jgi:hypothetical protein
MSMFLPEIKELGETAQRLARRNASLDKEKRNRDLCAYNLLDQALALSKQMLKIKRSDIKGVVKSPFGKRLPRTNWPDSFVIELAVPKLPAKQRSRYGAVLTFARHKKEDGVSMKAFLAKHGGINACATKGWKLRRVLKAAQAAREEKEAREAQKAKTKTIARKAA